MTSPSLQSTTSTYIQQTWPVIISSNRSSLGGGATYRRWLNNHVGVGLAYEQNPSDGKLFWYGHYYRWPQMRYEIAAVSSQQVSVKKVSFYIREGAGSIITNGYKVSGWSHDFAVLEALGVDYNFSKHVGLRAGMTVLEDKAGCYGDHTCRATWAATEDVALGPVFKW